jgi:predicted dinucleotide-binding enzyme
MLLKIETKHMKIAIIGSGHIGGNLARLLVKAGYEVALTNSRGPSSLLHFADELGTKLHPVTLEQAIDVGDIIIVAIHWRTLASLPVVNTKGKIVVDATNPYKEDGSLYDLDGDISSTKVMEHFPDAKVVKAFNTIWYKHLAENGNTSLATDDRRVIPVAGNELEAKKTVAEIIEKIGFGALDTGTLREGSKWQGAEGALYAKELTVKEARAIIQ